MWSATWPKNVRRLAMDFLQQDHLHTTIGSDDLTANEKITQIIDICSGYEKMDKLLRLLGEIMSERENKTLIFMETKRKCDEVTM